MKTKAEIIEIENMHIIQKITKSMIFKITIKSDYFLSRLIRARKRDFTGDNKVTEV